MCKVILYHDCNCLYVTITRFHWYLPNGKLSRCKICHGLWLSKIWASCDSKISKSWKKKLKCSSDDKFVIMWPPFTKTFDLYYSRPPSFSCHTPTVALERSGMLNIFFSPSSLPQSNLKFLRIIGQIWKNGEFLCAKASWAFFDILS